MSINLETNSPQPEIDFSTAQIDNTLLPKKDSERNVGALAYMFMWLGDGVNLGNMTLGASIVVVGVATLNLLQTFLAAIVAIGIITSVFLLNDQFAYKTGVPYVVQLRMAFGTKGTIVSSLMRGIPAIVWYGFQTWLGGTALNEIVKVITDGAFDNIFICFILLQVLQIVLSLYGFHAIKIVETIVSIVILAAFIYVFIILLGNYSDVILQNWVKVEGSWGLPFWSIVMVFMGNYAAIFLSAGDYSRELKKGNGVVKRGFMYFTPIMLAYGSVLAIGAMLAAATGISNPVKAFAVVIDNTYISVFVNVFIILGVIGVNMVANIIAPTYVIQSLTKMKYKPAVIITGLLGMCSFPWVLVQDSSSEGLAVFILIYSAFLGPIVSILIVDYFIIRKQNVSVEELYNLEGQFKGYNNSAIIAMLIGAFAAFLFVKLAWIIGLIIGGLSYYLLMKYTNKGSDFKKGTIFENN